VNGPAKGEAVFRPAGSLSAQPQHGLVRVAGEEIQKAFISLFLLASPVDSFEKFQLFDVSLGIRGRKPLAVGARLGCRRLCSLPLAVRRLGVSEKAPARVFGQTQVNTQLGRRLGRLRTSWRHAS